MPSGFLKGYMSDAYNTQGITDKVFPVYITSGFAG